MGSIMYSMVGRMVSSVVDVEGRIDGEGKH